jgi:hypothetical protein
MHNLGSCFGLHRSRNRTRDAGLELQSWIFGRDIRLCFDSTQDGGTVLVEVELLTGYVGTRPWTRRDHVGLQGQEAA